MHEQIKRIMADLLDLDPASIDGSTLKDNTSAWDSLSHINLVVALEQEFGVSFDLHEIESMLSYDDIVQIVVGKIG
jgi:acyl carrier protein